MKNIKRIADALLILCFFVFIFYPLAAADFEGGKLSAVENRMLAPAPDLANPSEEGLRSDVENWINDNAGGRSAASVIDTKLAWTLFEESNKSDTLMGKDQWLFYYTDAITADFRHENLMSQEDLDLVSKHVQMIGDYCIQKGADPLFVMLPDKKTVYADFYPDGMLQGKDASRADQLYAHLQKATSMPVLWLRDKLIDSRSLGYVYSQRVDNSHWNALGAYIGFESICEAFNQRYGNRISYTPLSGCTVEPYESEGWFNGAVAVSETDYRIHSGISGEWQDDSAYLDKFTGLSYSSSPETWKVRRINESTGNPSILFVGDSYTKMMFDYLSETFSEMTFLHMMDMKHLPELLDDLQPDYVVFEWVERMFDIQNISMWEAAYEIWCIENPQ